MNPKLTCPSGWHPAAKHMPAHQSNYRREPIDGRSIRRHVWHITSGRGVAEAVAEEVQNPGQRKSEHFVVGQNGQLVQVVSIHDIAWHAGSANFDSIGIECCAREPNEPAFLRGDPGLPISDAQFERMAELLAWLHGVDGLPIDREHNVGHSEADPTTTHDNCPNGVAGGFPWDKLLEKAAEIYAMSACLPPG